MFLLRPSSLSMPMFVTVAVTVAVTAAVVVIVAAAVVDAGRGVQHLEHRAVDDQPDHRRDEHDVARDLDGVPDPVDGLGDQPDGQAPNQQHTAERPDDLEPVEPKRD